jgi:hypothetical protein
VEESSRAAGSLLVVPNELSGSSTQRNGLHHLNAREVRAADLIASGRTDSQVSEELDVDRTTVWRWRTQNPYFQAEVNRRREEIWTVTRDRLQALTPLALDAIESELRTGEKPVGAALGLLRILATGALAAPSGPTDPEAIIDQLAVSRRRNSLQALIDQTSGNGPVSEAERAAVLRGLDLSTND